MPPPIDADDPTGGNAVQAVRGRVGRPNADSDGGKRVALTGIVEQGVEGRCVVLLDLAGSPVAELIGRPAADYPFGVPVRVTGRFAPGLSSGAQQGRPFQVNSIDWG